MAKKVEKKTVVKYRCVKNKSATADKVPWLVNAQSNGTVSVEELARRIHEKSPSLSEIDIRMVLNASNEVLQKILRDNPCTSIDMGFGVLKPVVEGSVNDPSELDEKLRKGEIKVKYKMEPSKKLKDYVKKEDFDFVCVNGPAAKISIRTVTTGSLGRKGVNAVSAGVEFKVAGEGFSDDELSILTVELTDSEGAVHTVEVVKVEPTVIDCVAPSALAKGKARLVITQALGPEESDGHLTASRTLTVV